MAVFIIAFQSDREQVRQVSPDAFTKLVANDPGSLQEADQANLLVRLEVLATRTLVSINVSVYTSGLDRIRIMEGIDQTSQISVMLMRIRGEPACAGNKAFFTAQFRK